MHPTNRRAVLIAVAASLLVMLALSACGVPDQPSAVTGSTSTLPTGVIPPADDIGAPTAVAASPTSAPTQQPAAPTPPAAPSATAAAQSDTGAVTDALATPTPVAVDDTDPFTGAGVLADTDDITVTVEITTTGELVETQPVAVAIAEYFGVPVAGVVALHEDGLGFGGIARAYFLARELAADGDTSNDLTAEQILALHQGGLGWGQIVAQVGLPQSNRDRNLGLIMSGREPRDADGTDSGVTTGDSQSERGNGPPAVPPGQQKEREQGGGNGGGNGNRGNGGGNGGGGKKGK
jgi:hypothetical protein